MVTALVSALEVLEHSPCDFTEYQYERALRSGLLAALGHAIRLGDETDFATGTPLRSFVIDNAEVMRDALLAPAGSVSPARYSKEGSSGVAVIERLLLFVT